MKTILSALIALSIIAGIAAPVSADVNAGTLYDQLDRSRY